MSTVAEQMGAIKTLAITAGATVTPPYTDVAIAAPVPRGRCIRIWWSGEQIPAPQADGKRYSLASELVGQGLVVTVFENLSDLSEELTEAAMGAMAAFVSAMRAAIDLDRTLGGLTMSVEPEAAPAEYAQLGQALYAFASMAMTTGLDEYPIGGS